MKTSRIIIVILAAIALVLTIVPAAAGQKSEPGVAVPKYDRAAEATFKRAVATNPDHDEAHLALANFYWATGQPVETEKELKKIRDGEPTGDAKRDALVHFVLNLQKTSGTISENEFAAIRAAGYTETQLAEISLAVAMTIFTNTFNRINDTDVDFPPVK